jgi:hypothetical protein
MFPRKQTSDNLKALVARYLNSHLLFIKALTTLSDTMRVVFVKPKNNTMKNIEKLIVKCAYKYYRYKDQLPDISQSEIDLFRAEVEQAFNRIPITVEFVPVDPYTNLAEMTADIEQSKRMQITSLHNESMLLPGVSNLHFRAVHDYLHYFLQQQFDFNGEYTVYKAQKALHSSKIGRKILKSEIVLQAAYCTHFGTFAAQQKIVL